MENWIPEHFAHYAQACALANDPMTSEERKKEIESALLEVEELFDPLELIYLKQILVPDFEKFWKANRDKFICPRCSERLDADACRKCGYLKPQ